MGTRKTKVPAIPEPRPDNLLEVAKALKEVSEVGEMRRGDKLDAKVTFRDLIDGGLATAGGGLGGVGGSGIGDPTNRTTPGPNSDFLRPPSYDGLVLPGRPANVHTMAVWDGIQVIWDWPDAAGTNTYWKRAVIWASATPDFERATIIGYSTTNFYTHTGIGLSAIEIPGVETQPGVRYYWVAWEGLWNEVEGAPDRSDTNPYQWEDGIYGKTAIDPTYTLEILSGQIEEHVLSLDLNARINLIDYNPDDPDNPFTTSVQERILSASTNTDGIYAAIAETAVTSVNESDGYAAGEYSIRIDANGNVAGFGLSAFSRINGDTGTREESSAFVISADYFAVVGRIPYDVNNPWNTGQQTENVYPFIVSTVGGQATVGINGQLVVDGSITATSIQAGSIGAAQINAQEIYADLLSATRIITGRFSTSVDPNMRLEINGEGGARELFPLWFGRGATGGAESVFYADKNGTMKLAGELYVTGAGKFFAGNFADGEWRLELGGPEDDFMLWAGTGVKSKSNENYSFWIDRFGDASFKGNLEAQYVSGEISRQQPIDDTAPINGKQTNATDPQSVGSSDWTSLGEWTLGASQFQPHLPTITINFNTYGTGVRAGAYRVLYKKQGGNWAEIYRGFINMWEYAANTTVIANAPAKTALETYFRLEFAGADGGRWTGAGPITCGRRNGYLLGLR